MDTCQNGQKKVLLFRVAIKQLWTRCMNYLFSLILTKKNAQAKQNGSKFIFNVKFSSSSFVFVHGCLAVCCGCGWNTRVVPRKSENK